MEGGRNRGRKKGTEGLKRDTGRESEGRKKSGALLHI